MQRALVQRALGVCAVVHVVTHFLSRAWGDCASESLGGAQQLLHPNPKGRHTPTAGRDHIHQHTFLSCLSSTNLSGGERGGRGPPRIPGLHCSAAVYVCPSPLSPLGSGTARTRKTHEATRQDGKNAWSQTLKTSCSKSLHLAGTPQHENAAGTAQKISVDVETIENPPSNQPGHVPQRPPTKPSTP